jgi:hypothetical protein
MKPTSDIRASIDNQKFMVRRNAFHGASRFLFDSRRPGAPSKSCKISPCGGEKDFSGLGGKQKRCRSDRRLSDRFCNGRAANCHGTFSQLNGGPVKKSPVKFKVKNQAKRNFAERTTTGPKNIRISARELGIVAAAPRFLPLFSQAIVAQIGTLCLLQFSIDSVFL